MKNANFSKAIYVIYLVVYSIARYNCVTFYTIKVRLNFSKVKVFTKMFLLVFIEYVVVLSFNFIALFRKKIVITYLIYFPLNIIVVFGIFFFNSISSLSDIFVLVQYNPDKFFRFSILFGNVFMSLL